MRLRSALPLLGLATLATTGCGDFLEQVQSEEVAIAALIRTPDATNPETNETIPGITTFTLFFGNIDAQKVIPKTDGSKEAQEGAFKGVAGASVTLEFKDGTGADRAVNPEDKGDGKYFIDSTNSQLTYNQAPYTVTIQWSGRTYKMQVTAPQATEMAEFKNLEPKVITEHPAGAPLTVTRFLGQDDPSKNPIALVHLTALTGSDQSEQWTNAPTDALGFLRLVLADEPWRQKSFQIPGDKFQAGKQYLVTLSAVERGTSAGPSDGSAALFPGSSFLAGVADAGGVIVK